MPSKWLVQLVDGTADAAFAVDEAGLISAWNRAAEELLGLTADQVAGQPCHEILQGRDDMGPFCSPHCSIHHALQMNQPVVNFDLELQTKEGREWCNLTIEIIMEPGSSARHAVHVVRPLDMQRLIEQLGRVMMAKQGTVRSETAARLVSSGLTDARDVRLTPRENEILRMLANGTGTHDIADQLHISPVTVNNHVQHILEKLDSHSRLEVVFRAREAGII